MEFQLQSKYKPAGDQPEAIEKLVKKFQKDPNSFSTLLGVTGSGKTFTVANVIQQLQKPTLVIAHNKTLAAQLASEFKEFFPNNSVCYFVSYYDYYQPEAYIAKTDTFIEKETMINEEIERYRHNATISLLTRKDVIIVASVSCIYGLGPVENYKNIIFDLHIGDKIKREDFLKQLIELQYERSNIDFKPGMFDVLGDVIELYLPNSEDIYRIEFFDEEIENICICDHITGNVKQNLEKVTIFPAKHYIMEKENLDDIINQINKDLKIEYDLFKKQGKEFEAHRLKTRIEYDMQLLKETGYINGIENYSRYFDKRKEGQPPFTLLDYFPENFLMVIDESHMTIPQIGGMYEGDKSRKSNLINYGFRLKAAFDNRPLKFNEFEEKMKRGIFVSATPNKYEIKKSNNYIVEQIVRPTGLVDPKIEIRPKKNQIDNIKIEITKRIEKKERVLITTLTKRSAEDLADYLLNEGLKVRYLHSEIDTVERIEIIRDLRLGKFDVLVGINLLREGLDIPEVSLIIILDADQAGFLRSETALIQTIGRCARNVNGMVIMYADKITPAMKNTIEETNRRRKKQEKYNKENNIKPQTIYSQIKTFGLKSNKDKNKQHRLSKKEKNKLIAKLELEMDMYSANLDFENAIRLREQIKELKQ